MFFLVNSDGIKVSFKQETNLALSDVISQANWAG